MPPSPDMPAENGASTGHRRSFKRTAAIVLLALLIAAGVQWTRPQQHTSDQLFQQARILSTQRNWADSEQAAVAALDAAPQLPAAQRAEAALLASRCALELGDRSRARQHLVELDRQLPITQALAVAERLHYDIAALHVAEEFYREVLQRDPDHIQANEQLARLLGTCGRRHDAIPLIINLIRRGHETDLLILLARPDGSISDPELLKRARQFEDDPNPLLGLAAEATGNGDHKTAARLLRDATSLPHCPPIAWAQLGQQLALEGDLPSLRDWSDRVPDEANQYPETWLARATLAQRRQEHSGAARCYWEALKRDPTSRQATYQLAQSLAHDRPDQSRTLTERLSLLDKFESSMTRALFSGRQANVAELLEFVSACVSCGRIWEASAWCQVALSIDPANNAAQQLWDSIEPRLDDLPLALTDETTAPARLVDLSDVALPDFKSLRPQVAASGRMVAGRIRFRQDENSTGFGFKYDNGTPHGPRRRMFEFSGGGLAVIDFDQDGFADIYCTQGGGVPLQTAPTRTDRMFRNRGGQRFEDCSDRLGLTDAEFGQGVTVGDFDSDGFPDLRVANIGRNRLWLNNGDGTFTEAASHDAEATWTTSCLMVDLNHDGHPDLYDVNYLQGVDLWDRVCRSATGEPRMCMPFEFDAAADRLWLNSGDGRLEEPAPGFLDHPLDGKGLGILAWDRSASGRLSVLVANDTTANFLLTPEDRGDGAGLTEQGISSGLAMNDRGKAEGCMGIAAADITGDGLTDLCVTNFLAETNTLYASLGQGLFQDRTRELNLQSTFDSLGFGTQFLDADLDGSPELFVANGHIDDLRSEGRPYRMRPQLFTWDGQRFQLAAAESVGSYFEREWLGRAAARLDWNQDSLPDLIVGHLDDPSALLTNLSEPAGKSLVLRLIATSTARDAIGTTVRVRCGPATQSHQLTAGDGYQASNERRILIGCGAAAVADEVRIDWPSGTQQVLSSVPLPAAFVIREGLPVLPEVYGGRAD